MVSSSHCTSAAVCWLGTAEELLRSQAGSLSASEASPDFCLSLLCFLKHIGKEDACCETCSKKEIKAHVGLWNNRISQVLAILTSCTMFAR